MDQFIQRTHRVRLMNLCTTDKKSLYFSGSLTGWINVGNIMVKLI